MVNHCPECKRVYIAYLVGVYPVNLAKRLFHQAIEETDQNVVYLIYIYQCDNVFY